MCTTIWDRQRRSVATLTLRIPGVNKTHAMAHLVMYVVRMRNGWSLQQNNKREQVNLWDMRAVGQAFVAGLARVYLMNVIFPTYSEWIEKGSMVQTEPWLAGTRTYVYMYVWG